MIIENISPYLLASVMINSEKITLNPLDNLELDINNGTQKIIFHDKEYIVPLSTKNPIKLDPENNDVYFSNQPLPPLKNVDKKQNFNLNRKTHKNNWLFTILFIIIIIIIVIFIILK